MSYLPPVSHIFVHIYLAAIQDGPILLIPVKMLSFGSCIRIFFKILVQCSAALMGRNVLGDAVMYKERHTPDVRIQTGLAILPFPIHLPLLVQFCLHPYEQSSCVTSHCFFPGELFMKLSSPPYSQSTMDGFV